MQNLLKRATGKITRSFYDVSATVNALMDSAQLPEIEDAISYLQQNAPDPGNSCWTTREADYEKRTLLLSVIVPAYNVEKYITGCLESVLQQHVSFDYEIIVVNDGSTDATAELLKKYEHNERVRILHQNNLGLSAARNAGIACAKGEYLCFIDSDDELTEGSLEHLMTAALQEHAKLVVGSYEQCLRDGTVLHTERLKKQKVAHQSMPGYAWGRVIHYSIFRNLQFPEGYWFEDSIMTQIVHPLCQDSTYTTPHVCYRYYFNEAGITSIANGNMKSIDSLWITMQLLKDRVSFHLPYTQASYEHFLFMVRLTYHRTKYLNVHVAQCIFVIQRILMDQYYSTYQTQAGRKSQQIEKALRTNDFRKYVLACA